MRKKLYVLVITLLIIFSTIVIIPRNFKVEASSGGDGGADDGSIGLDYWYMWNVTQFKKLKSLGENR